MFTNKHVIVAMLVAPILAVIAWFGVDRMVAEEAQPVVAGGTYSLLARSNCRYDSGQCDLENADLKLALVPFSSDDGAVELRLRAWTGLQGVTVGLVTESGSEQRPSPMTRMDDTGMKWTTGLPQSMGENSTLRIAVRAQDATWYAEVPTVFMDGF